MDAIAPKPICDETLADIDARVRAAAERGEHNPWIFRLHAAQLEAAQTNSDTPLIAFERQVFAARQRGDPWLTGKLVGETFKCG
jgi:hypothetical protein